MKNKKQNKIDSIEKTNRTQKRDIHNSNLIEFTKHYYLPAALIFAIIYFMASDPTITGSAIGIEDQITENLDLTFTEYSAYSFSLQGNPTSIKLSGTVEGNTKIYLLDGFEKYLIYETTENSDNLLTGFAIAIPEEITENETTNETIIEIIDNNESIDNIVETVNETTETINDTNDQLENTNNNTIEETLNESIETNTTETNDEQTQETDSIIEFSNICIETCSITNLSSTIELAIEVNGSLTLTSISYTIEETNTLETTNITLDNNQSILEINETDLTLNETNTSIETNQSVDETNLTVSINNPVNSTDVDITIKKFFTYHITKLTYENGMTRIKFDILGEINETKEEVATFKEQNNLGIAELKDLAQEQAKENYEMIMIGDDLGQIYDLITQVDTSLKTNIEANLE